MIKAAEYKDLPFDDAIKFFGDKVKLPTGSWLDIFEGMHSRAFVVAGATKTELLSDLFGAVDKAISQGTTIQEFRKDFDELVSKHGWGYKGGRNWRTGVIFNTNLRTAYSAGHYKQMTSPEMIAARPYWRYIGGLSSTPREQHLEWNGLVLLANDPWWTKHYPPNGWGCKCKVVSHSERELERKGLSVSTAPEEKTYKWKNPNTGEILNVPDGIDPGWAYNPGKTAWGESISHD
ncbi:MAG: hypothetical protein KAR06_02255, partial [Deltaproteobacteria bacterium]|nr:hypothetical protein [Deltaproteobacteria bacterium]